MSMGTADGVGDMEDCGWHLSPPARRLSGTQLGARLRWNEVCNSPSSETVFIKEEHFPPLETRPSVGRLSARQNRNTIRCTSIDYNFASHLSWLDIGQSKAHYGPSLKDNYGSVFHRGILLWAPSTDVLPTTFLPRRSHAAVRPPTAVPLSAKARARIRDGGEADRGPLLYLDWQMNSSFARAPFTILWESCLVALTTEGSKDSSISNMDRRHNVTEQDEHHANLGTTTMIATSASLSDVMMRSSIMTVRDSIRVTRTLCHGAGTYHLPVHVFSCKGSLVSESMSPMP
ncbi:hypothetical protein EYF80_014613 [Liparis tanakae]|uniref:Uncharacterized protein n=1 Tax=Liparis tanakae TaxID=230148 RepID=A0A4Z2IDX5_9TELE|nr:hypothetical protein EYF80_014613 [Liparis tanakae]